MANTQITCGECGTELHGDNETSLEERTLCPTCGSLSRSVFVTITSVSRATDSMPTTPADPSERNYHLRITPLDDGVDSSCLVEVFPHNRSKHVTGIGKTQVDALLNIIGYLLPEDHPDYPESSETPDDE
jgi:hypothetical protein